MSPSSKKDNRNKKDERLFEPKILNFYSLFEIIQYAVTQTDVNYKKYLSLEIK